MKNLFARLMPCVMLVLSLACFAGTTYGQEYPDRIILFIIDGLATDAPDKIDMPNYNALRKEGVYYQAMHLVLDLPPMDRSSTLTAFYINRWFASVRSNSNNES